MAQEGAPTDARRLQSFAQYFERYMNGLGLIVVALPLPLSGFDLLPTFHFQTGPLAVGTTFFGILLAGIIFYYRHPLARFFFAKYLEDAETQDTNSERGNAPAVGGGWTRVAPPLLLLTSVVVFFIYLAVLNTAVDDAWYNVPRYETEQRAYEYGQRNSPPAPITRQEVLNEADPRYVESQLWLGVLYVGIFLPAEAALLLMALKEYLQDVLNITEHQLIYRS
jgi:hypothetical protein